MNPVRFCLPVTGLLTALFVAVLFPRGPSLAQEKGKDQVSRPGVKWEYKVVQAEEDPAKMEGALNTLGEEGWECIGAVNRVSIRGAAYLICKRPKEAVADAPRGKEQLDGSNYRLRVEPILDGAEDLAIYRIQIWTLGKRNVYLHLGKGKDITQEGLSRPEPESKLHRAEFVVVVSLRPADNLGARGQQLQLERSLRVRGGGAMVLTDTVDAKTQLRRVVQIKEHAGTHKLGEAHEVGELFGKVIAAEAE
jgi:hypothetical protein